MPIDYTHPGRINYEHPGRGSRARPATADPVADSPADPVTEASSSQPINYRRRDRVSRPAPDRQDAAPVPTPTPRVHANDQVTCACGATADRSVLAQCVSCGADLWALAGVHSQSRNAAAAPVTARRPVGFHLPESAPEYLDNGFVAQMQSYSDGLRASVNAGLEYEGRVVDSEWKQVAAAILRLHWWDPSALTLEVLRVNIMKLKIQEWAARGGMADLSEIGWTHVLDFVETIDTVDTPGDRDWTTGDIELQHVDAIPQRFDHLESIRRIGAMVADVDSSGQDVFIKLANVFNGHIKDFGRRNNCELEIVATDITDAITSRSGWLPDWAFAWPTYFGELGVYAYNDWVCGQERAEWYIAKYIIDEARGAN